MGKRKLILVVESRKKVVDILRFVLNRAGYSSPAAYDGETALESFQAKKPGLVLLDASLSGGMNGFEVCEAIRQISQEAPIVMMVAQDETEDALWAGLRKGDFVVKPFPMPMLLTAIKAALGRAEPSEELPDAADKAVPIAGELAVNRDSRQVFLARHAVILTAQEYNLLVLLADHPNKVFSREELLRQVWHYDNFLEKSSRTVDVLIRRLREKIEAAPARPTYILTRRGAGYYFSA